MSGTDMRDLMSRAGSSGSSFPSWCFLSIRCLLRAPAVRAVSFSTAVAPLSAQWRDRVDHLQLHFSASRSICAGIPAQSSTTSARSSLSCSGFSSYIISVPGVAAKLRDVPTGGTLPSWRRGLHRAVTMDSIAARLRHHRRSRRLVTPGAASGPRSYAARRRRKYRGFAACRRLRGPGTDRSRDPECSELQRRRDASRGCRPDDDGDGLSRSSLTSSMLTACTDDGGRLIYTNIGVFPPSVGPISTLVDDRLCDISLRAGSAGLSSVLAIAVPIMRSHHRDHIVFLTIAAHPLRLATPAL